MAEQQLKETLEIDDERLEAGAGSIGERALARYRIHVQDNRELMRELIEDAQKNQKFYSPLGDQWPDDLADIFSQLNIPMKSVNEVWPVVASITGRESTSRFIPKITGRDPEDSGLADAFNTAIRKIREGDDMEQSDSACFRQAAVRRVGATEIFVDAFSSRTPKMKQRRLPLETLLLDFGGTECNYRDSRGIAHGRYLNRWDFDERFPEHDSVWDEIVELGDTSDYDERDPWMNTVEGNGFLYRRKTRTTFIVDFEWIERQPIDQLELPGEVAEIWQGQFGEQLPVDVETREDDPQFLPQLAMATAAAEQYLQQVQEQAAQMAQQPPVPGQPPPEPPPDPLPKIYRNLTSAKQLMMFKSAYIQHAGQDFTNYYRLKPEVVYYASFVGMKVLEAGRRKDGMWTMYPLIPFMDEKDGRQIPYGVVDLLKKRQQIMNAALALYLHSMAYMSKAAFGYDTDSGDPAAVQAINTATARGDRVIPMPGGKKALVDLPQGRMPDGVERFFDKFMALVPGGAGQSQYGVGTAPNLARTASRLVEQQISAMNSTIGEAFDSLRQFRRATTRKHIGNIITTWSVEDFRRAAGPHAKYVPDDKSQWWAAYDYDIVVGEEASTRDMAQAALDSMVDTGMWQWVSQLAPEVIAKVAHPIWGAASDDLLTKIQEQEPGRMVEALAELTGIDPGALQAFIDGGGEPAPEGVPNA